MEEFCKHMDISSQQEITFKTATLISSTDFHVESISLSELPGYMLNRIMTLDSRSRQFPKMIQPLITGVQEELSASNIQKTLLQLEGTTSETNAVHPMDVVIYLFIQCHPIFRQIFVTQLAKCLLSLPLVTSYPSLSEPTFNIFSLKTLYKDFLDENNEPKSFSVVEEKLPIVSFLRMGDCVGSRKSQMLNQIIGIPNYFFHRDQIDSVKKRFFFDGTVEIAWILPKPESQHKTPYVILNLRGNALRLRKQLMFISDVSTLIYIFIPINLCDQDMSRRLGKFHEDFGPKTVYLLYKGDGVSLEPSNVNTSNFLIMIDNKKGNYLPLPKTNLGADSLLIADDIVSRINNVQNILISLTDCASVAKKHSFTVDTNKYNLEFCQSVVDSILQHLSSMNHPQTTANPSGGNGSSISLGEIKKSVLPLQMEAWSEWAKAKRALNKFDLQESEDLETANKLMKKQMKEARNKQLEYLRNPSHFIIKVINHCRSFGSLSGEFYIIWTLLQNEFNSISKQHLPPLYKEYRKWHELSCSYIPSNEGRNSLKKYKDSLIIAAKKIAESSFGIEHVFRELGQIFEAYDWISQSLKKKQIDQNLKFKISKLSDIAAKLLFEGFSFEIVDGDTNHVPITWVMSVLENLAHTIGPDKKIFVLSILGTQSSGKSTLLNIMFGANFAVSSGRCTRGMFMQLFPIENKLSAALGYEYLVLLDTEGLRAPEFSLSSYRRDNEMATFAVGLGDVTIINMPGECHSEVQDILQIIVFAFIRMKQTESRPRCVFAHQNVADTQAKTNLTLARGNLIRTLNKITVSAAEQENLRNLYTQFAEVIEFNPEEDVFYFPGLLEGEPPLCQVAPGYTKMALKLRHHILNAKQNKEGKKFHTVEDWSRKLKSLWKSVICENFVFSYRNALEVQLRRQLDHDLSFWYSRYINAISNLKSERLDALFNSNPEELKEIFNKTSSEITRERMDPKLEIEFQMKLMQEYFVEHENLEVTSHWKANTEMQFKVSREKLIDKIEREYGQVHRVQLAKKDMDIQFSKSRREIVKIVHTLFQDLQSKGRTLKENSVIENEFQIIWDRWKEKIDIEEFPADNINLDLQKALIQSPIIKSMCVLPKKSALIQDVTTYLEIGEQDFKFLSKMNSPEHSDSHYFTFNDLNKKKGIRAYISDLFHGRDTKKAGLNQFLYILEVLKEISYRCIQEYSSSLMRDQCSYDSNSFFVVIEKCNHILENHNISQKNNHHQFELTTDFFFDFIFYQCCKTIPMFQEIQNNFRSRTSLDSKFKHLESQLKESFISHCDGIQSEHMCADVMAQITTQGMKDYLNNEVSKTFLSSFQNDPEHATIYLHKDALILHILKYLARRRDFNEYIRYIINPFNYIISYIQDRLTEYSKRTHVIQSCVQALLTKVKSLIQLYKQAGYNASPDQTVCTSVHKMISSWNKFKTVYHSKIKGKVRNLTSSDLDVLDVHSISNYAQFCEFFSQELDECVRTTDWTLWFKSVLETDKTLYKTITDNLLECQTLCPFCKEPCQLAIGKHEHYCATFHRPSGLSGWRHIVTQKISAKECTTSIQDRDSFYYHDTKYEYVNYRTVNDEFKSWKILAEDALDSKYWQWVLYQFQDEFVDYYNIAKNEAVSVWSDLTEEEVVKDLEAHYQSYFFKKN